MKVFRFRKVGRNESQANQGCIFSSANVSTREMKADAYVLPP